MSSSWVLIINEFFFLGLTKAELEFEFIRFSWEVIFLKFLRYSFHVSRILEANLPILQ